MNDKSEFIDWNEEYESAEKQIETFRQQAVLYEISIDEVNIFLTSCKYLCETGREGALKSRLDDQLRIYKRRAPIGNLSSREK